MTKLLTVFDMVENKMDAICKGIMLGWMIFLDCSVGNVGIQRNANVSVW